ncbi:hypothetical protein OG352_06655 [Streptomyces sp. NBC_01485]|uniref:hypothetical protein n=1 Tax=Streptomyces sp. NBC_01485 TaxID=2903884 RepID=UPI002E3004FF|nr:hypothetical protein [Streptomyces sp. NBC_01485]
MSGRSAGLGTVDVLALLPLPALDGLSQERVRGAACIWCDTRLDTATAVDLGERRHRRLDGHYSTFPRACPACVREAAIRAIRDHPGMCEQCTDDASHCDVRAALEHLAREGR